MKKILSIEIENSNFFEDKLKINFSDKFNCIMGGRGTGKSTILHFLKAALISSAEENKNTYNILKSNLGNGTITIRMEGSDGKKYKIQKTIDDLPQAYSLPGDNFIDIENIENYIDCDFYEAQTIEEIGKSSISRLELIDKMIVEEKSEIEEEIEDVQIEMVANAQQIKTESSKLNLLKNNIKQFENAEDELKKLLEEKPEDLNKTDEKEFEDADKNEKIRTSEKRYIKNITNKILELNGTLSEVNEDVINFKNNHSNIDKFTNQQEIKVIKEKTINAVDKVISSILENQKILRNTLKELEGISNKLTEKHSIQQNDFVKLKQKFDKHKEFYNKWNGLTKKIDDKNALVKEIKSLESKQDKVKKQRRLLVLRLAETTKKLFNLRKTKIDELNRQFEGSIKITLTFNGNTDHYEEILRNALRGSNMRYNAIIPNIIQNFSPDKFAEIVHTKDYDTLKKVAGIDKERSESIFNALFETDAIYNIEMLYCPDLPDFLLKIDEKNNIGSKLKENYKISEELSTGQRCTTVLPIVFAVSKNPLIIDQPEDNLDNKYISETIHEIIRIQKEERQLIFITHNPNIPVLSDSEKNIFLNYSSKKSKIDSEGKVNEVKENILNLLEGGKEAFEKREKLYNLNRK